MEIPRWEVVEGLSENNMIALGFDGTSEAPRWYTFAKWDGCIHLYHNPNGFTTTDDDGWPRSEYPDSTEYFHMCDYGGIETLIAMLVSLVARGQGFYADKATGDDVWRTDEDIARGERIMREVEAEMAAEAAGIITPYMMRGGLFAPR